jgi:hypothetical protein
MALADCIVSLPNARAIIRLTGSCRLARPAIASHPRFDPHARAYHSRVAITMRTTDSITGTSTSTPTTVARAAPE